MRLSARTEVKHAGDLSCKGTKSKYSKSSHLFGRVLSLSKAFCICEPLKYYLIYPKGFSGLNMVSLFLIFSMSMPLPAVKANLNSVLVSFPFGLVSNKGNLLSDSKNPKKINPHPPKHIPRLAEMGTVANSFTTRTIVLHISIIMLTFSHRFALS
mmetsp:Transcript_12924/g.24007  ORF Transcript_12924/g.24007 Transcript_12924/m.24007 type:complete len:155 (-) Transcript_12924:1346-1810(-)